MNSNQVKSDFFSVTGLFVFDETNNGYTGTFAELPWVIAEGGSREEVQANLFEALREFSKEEMEARVDQNVIEGSFPIVEKMIFKMELA
ncbi:MAG: hypothetical protein P0Y49_12500 [Candidatus Pedobacter colombiensis]|uniref:Uncharacterized protein n=1 Tax=Candidatus Pedobacter colombiensis TaxID=3121371 RepID=A0AAJ5W4V2_9SPHI|nr:hypothetical protein [Pedobacter sp.]WEK17615.1 MAG: hypothetical protein P0Y49_12500 [Pedobacter sp.]